MTNYVNELMKAAGVGYIIKCKHGEEFPENCDCNYPCEECSACIKKYPAFTPAKQLELIKLILKADNVDSFSQYYSEVLKAFVFTCKSLPEMNTYNVWESINTDYALALAELVLRLIEENQLDKSEVKRILKDG